MKSVATARIAFQGERGAFSEEAALKLLGDDITLVPCATFDATFSAIRERAADYVLAPMENSLAGSVHRSFDLLVESGLQHRGRGDYSDRAQLDRRAGSDDRASRVGGIASRGARAMRTIFHRESALKANSCRRYRGQRAQSNARRRFHACGHRQQARR